MKIKLLTLLALLCCINSYSQIITLNDTPNLVVILESEEKPIYISAVDKKVEIVGCFATTTIEYTIYNPNSRTLEASFEFSLSDGQYISGFALDLDGNWRDGVPVEKAKGQQVFESIIRQNIDPALLEKTVGNNYRARVYPLLGKASRKVRVTLDQELGSDHGLQALSIPVSCTDSLDYNLTIEVQGDHAPILNQSLVPNFNFRKSGNSYVASLHLTGRKVDSGVNVVIPKSKQEETKDIFVEKCMNSEDYAFYTRVYPEVNIPQQTKPKTIDLYWDISASAKDRNLSKELSFLNDYLSRLGDVEINLYTFHIHLFAMGKFQIKNGDWSKLKQVIKAQTYDGASQLGNISISKSSAEMTLIFSDGVSNFGRSDIQINPKSTEPIIFVSSSPKANFDYMKYWSNKTKGAFINLLAEDNEQALKSINTPSIQLINTKYNTSQIQDLVINRIVGSNNGYSVVGKLLQSKAELELEFGIGKSVLYTKKIILEDKVSKDFDGLIEKVWAERTIDKLSLVHVNYKAQIADIAKKYNIVTDNMSLIVLDRIEDYVTYKITPPQELLEEYNTLLEEESRDYQSNYDDRMNNLKYDFEERIAGRKKKEKYNYPTEPIQGTASYNNGKVFGKLIDSSDNYGAIGLSIINLKTRDLAITDLDGNFEIKAQLDDILIFGYVGYEERRQIVVNSSMKVDLSPYQPLLEMVVMSSNATAITPFQAPEIPVFANAKSDDMEVENELNKWDVDASYLDILEKSNTTEIYANYLNIKDKYNNTPSFFLDVSTLFEAKGLHQQSLLILSNLAELELQNYKLMRVLAHRLSQLGYHKLAQPLFEQVLVLRPEEPQSYRDLALCYEQNKEYQKAINMFYQAIQTEWDDRFEGIEIILLEEMNHTIAVAKRKGKNINLKNIDKRLIKPMPLDIRIILNWDTDNSDMDLEVTDPDEETCYFGNQETEIGGMMSDDLRGGYGPEEFLLKKAIKGIYKISVDYYDSQEQTIIGPTTIYLDIFTNYGRSNEKKQTIMKRLHNVKNGMVDIGEIKW